MADDLDEKKRMSWTTASTLSSFPASASQQSPQDDESMFTERRQSGVSFASASVASSSLRRTSDASSALVGEFSERVQQVESNEARRKKANVTKAISSLTVNQLQISKLGLVGRDAERESLLESLDRVVGDVDKVKAEGTGESKVAATGSRELVLIGGASGMGKSALALSLKEPVEAMGGAFLGGKFDSIPYSAISQVFCELCGKVLMDTKEKQVRIANELEEVLGNEMLAALLAVVPELEELLPSAAPADLYQRNSMISGGKKHQQVNHAFRLLTRIVTRYYRPMVVHLDDLQMSDMASLDVLEVLLMDRQTTGLLVLGGYRDNEVDDSHLFSKCLRDLKEKSSKEEGDGGHAVIEIDIGPLNLVQVKQVVTILLGIDPEVGKEDRTGPLADICFKRTGGNPLFLISFLSLLCGEEYLKFNLGTFRWTWDVDTIEAQTASTDNVLQIIMEKMHQVDPDLGQLLQIASLLGAKFDDELLFLVWTKLPRDATMKKFEDRESFVQYLERAVEQSFIEVARPKGYRWVHDKVQEAACSLIKPEDLPTFQFDVGIILLRNLDEQTMDSLLFVVADLLDSKECLDVDLNSEIANLCAKAARKARGLSAFVGTSKYAAAGLKHMNMEGKAMWDTKYDLALELHCAAVEAESVLGNSDAMNAYADEVLNKGRTVLDKVPVFICLATCMGKQGLFAESNKLCVDAINQLQVTTVPHGLSLMRRAASGLFSTKKLLVSADANTYPIMTDPSQIATMKLLDLTASYAFQAKNTMLLLFCTIKMVRLTVRHGMSSPAPSAFAQYGALVFGVLNDLKAGVDIGEMALEMTNRLEGVANNLPNKSLVILRTWGFTLSYSRPIRNALKPLLQGHSDGMKFGDTEMASWCLFKHAYCLFHVSKPLGVIEEDCRLYVPYIRDLGWTEVHNCAKYIHQAALFLMGEEEEALSFLFANPTKDEEEFSHLTQAVVRSAAYAYTASYKIGAEYALEIGDKVKTGAPGHMLLQGDAFTRAICLYAMALETKKRRYLKSARVLRKRIENWRTQGCVNFEHQLLLLNAEDAALRGKKEEASTLYREAIVGATRFGFLRDAGLMHERYANFSLILLGEEDSATYHAKKSVELFQEWGATRAANAVASKYSELLPGEDSLAIGNSFIGIPDGTSNVSGFF